MGSAYFACISIEIGLLLKSVKFKRFIGEMMFLMECVQMPTDDEAQSNAGRVTSWLSSSRLSRASARASAPQPFGPAVEPGSNNYPLPRYHPALSTTDAGTSQTTTLVNTSRSIDSQRDVEPQPMFTADVHDFLQNWQGHGQVTALRQLAADNRSEHSLATTVSISTNDAIERVTGRGRGELRQSPGIDEGPAVEPAVAGPSNATPHLEPRGVKRAREESVEPDEAPPAQRPRYHTRSRGPADGRGL